MTTYIDADGNRFDPTTAASAVYQDLDGIRGGVTFQDADGNRVIVGRSLHAKWTSTLLPEVGPAPYWATNSAVTARPTVIDRLGVLRYCLVNEARFSGARRVENLLRYSNTLTNAAWVATGTASVSAVSTDADLVGEDGITCYQITGNGTSNALYQQLSENGAGTASGVLRASKHTFSIWLRGGSVTTATFQLYVSGGATAATATVTLSTTEWRRFAITGTPDGTSTYRVLVTPGSSGTIYARQAQLEDMAGETADASSNVPPSEYVSRDNMTYPSQNIALYNGAMVDGVQYFETERGNTLNNTTKLVTEAAGAEIADATLKGVLTEPQCVNYATNSETLSGWTVNGTSLTITAGSGTSPTGVASSAVLLTEDASSTDKYCSLDISGLTDSVRQCLQIYAKAGTRSYLRLSILNKAGTLIKGYFNLSTGALGTIDSGGKGYIWSIGNGWYFCALVASSGTGATTPQGRIGIANADGATTYTGNGSTISVWGAQFHQKEHPQSYIRTAGTTAERTGHALGLSMSGLLGLNDFAFYCEQYAWYDSGIANKTNNGISQDWYYPYYMRSLVPNQVYSRLGQSIRPGNDATVSYAIWAMDRYLGEPTQALKWTAATAYAVGDVVVPTATQANNANLLKLYECTQAGVSHATTEPTWNTSGFPTTEQTDGTCKWQSVGPPNSSQGTYDPNDGVHTYVNVAAQTLTRMASWFSSTPEVGCYINGTAGILTTEPFPIDQSAEGDLHYAVNELRIDRTSNSYAHSSKNTRQLMAWNRRVSGEYFRIATGG